MSLNCNIPVLSRHLSSHLRHESQRRRLRAFSLAGCHQARRQAWLRRRKPRAMTASSNLTAAEVATMGMPMAQAGAVLPASAVLRAAIALTCVTLEQGKTTAAPV